MNSELYQRVQAVIDQVFDAKEIDRESILKRLVAGDSELEGEVRSLLAGMGNDHELHPMSDHQLKEQRRRLDAIIDQPIVRTTQHIDQIGEYEIVGVLGDGGMGVVYRAVQSRPSRNVALKVIDVLRADGEIEKRFKAEAEIQGRLQHPGIVQVYEAGVTHIGHTNRPYIAMELVDGVSLVSYADRNGLSTRCKLELLAKVADAVGYAHVRGVVHRDLKPENILVRADGQPKVLDFGIARLTSDATLVASTMTQGGQLLGTLAFMAPEQFSGDEITPATDVYALGVIAFELLAGRPPIELSNLSIAAAMKMIDIQDLPKLRDVVPDIDRDIETVVSKCLRSEPDRRYQNAAEFADEVRRILADRPITARPPDTMYLTRKYIKRNRIFVGGVIATMITLIVGIIVASVFAVGQFEAQVLAKASEREARLQKTVLAGNQFQSAVSMSESGDVFGAIEVLESIPDWLRGWGWEMLASGMPRWMPGDNEFGGIGGVHIGIPADLESGTQNSFSIHGTHVLVIAGRNLHKWNPLTQTDQILFPELSIDKIMLGYSDTTGHIQIVVAANDQVSIGERMLLNIDTDSIQSTPPNFQPNANTNMRYNAEFNAAIWHHPTDNIESTDQHRTLYFWDEQNGTQSFLRSYPATPGELVYKIEGTNRYILIGRSVYGQGERVFEIMLFDSGTNQVVKSLGVSKYYPTLCPLPDRDEIAIRSFNLSMDESVKLYNLKTLEFRRTLEFDGVVVASIPELDALVARSSDNVYTLIRAEDGHVLQEYFVGHPNKFGYPLIHRDCNMYDGEFLLAIGPRPFRPVLVDTIAPESGLKPLMTALPHEGGAYNIAVSPNGGLLATYHPFQNTLCIMDARSGDLIVSYEPDSPSSKIISTSQLYFTKDSALVYSQNLSSGESHSLAIRNITTGKYEFIENRETIIGFASSELDRLVPLQPLSARAVVHPNGNGLVLNQSRYEGRLAHIEKDGTRSVDNLMATAEGLAISPDGKDIVMVAEGSVEFFDFESREQIAPPIMDRKRLLCASYSPDGKTLAVGTYDGRIMIIETEYYTKLFDFIASPKGVVDKDTKFVYMLAWSPDGQTLYSTHSMGYTRSWGTTRPYEHRRVRAEQIAADERVNAILNGLLADGMNAHSAGNKLLSDTSLSAVERAAAEVALVRAWPIVD